MNCKMLEIAKHLEAVGQGDMFDLGAVEIGQVEAWFGPLAGSLRARTLSALINDAADANLVEECAASIARLDGWPDLLRELLMYGEFSRQVATVARHVLRVRQPDHPLASESAPLNKVAMICDALCDGDRVTFRVSDALNTARPWLFLDPEDIITRVAVSAVYLEGLSVSLPVSGLPWLDPRQAACPAFALIA